MPFSRSRSIESSTRSATSWFARNEPDCQSIASTSVVLPWSTCATIATLRRSERSMTGQGTVTFVAYRLVARTGHPDFLDLPWARPPEEWETPRFVEVARGLGRHVVRFVDYDGSLYALKELPPRLAQREYRLLRALAELGLPAVEPVGVVSERGASTEAVLLTRHLEYSLPYRLVLTRAVLPAPLDLLL